MKNKDGGTSPSNVGMLDQNIEHYYVTIISGLIAMRNMLGEDAKRLIADNPDWDQSKDARITVFWNAQTVLASTALGLIFVKRMFREDSLWEIVKINEEEQQAIAKEHLENGLEGFVKLGLIQVLFSVIESAFRAYLRAFEPNAFSKGTAGFIKIYNRLQKHLVSIPQDSITLLELWTELRNAIHNNGVYFNPKGNADVAIVYKGQTYNFRNAQKIDFADWKRLLLLVLDLRELILQIVNDEKLRGINQPILDLSQ